MIPAATSRVAPQQYYCHRFYSHRGIAAISAPPSPPCRPGLQYGPRDPGCCWGAGCGGSRISWGRSHGSYVHNSMTELYDCATTSEAFVLSTSFLGPHVTSEPEPPRKTHLSTTAGIFSGPVVGALGGNEAAPRTCSSCHAFLSQPLKNAHPCVWFTLYLLLVQGRRFIHSRAQTLQQASII
jgi:hypothetical protein